MSADIIDLGTLRKGKLSALSQQAEVERMETRYALPQLVAAVRDGKGYLSLRFDEGCQLHELAGIYPDVSRHADYEAFEKTHIQLDGSPIIYLRRHFEDALKRTGPVRAELFYPAATLLKVTSGGIYRPERGGQNLLRVAEGEGILEVADTHMEQGDYRQLRNRLVIARRRPRTDRYVV